MENKEKYTYQEDEFLTFIADKMDDPTRAISTKIVKDTIILQMVDGSDICEFNLSHYGALTLASHLLHRLWHLKQSEDGIMTGRVK